MRSRKKGYKSGIKTWPSEDRPREKLIKNGEHTLSNSELLAILLRSGAKGQSAVDLARDILQFIPYRFITLEGIQRIGNS